MRLNKVDIEILRGIQVGLIEGYSVVRVRVMSNKEYDRIKVVMEQMGLYWDEGIKGFKGKSDIEWVKSEIRRVISLGVVDVSKEYIERERSQYYPTPDDIAKYMVSLSGIRYGGGKVVLEPSAGKGAILQYLVQYMGNEINAVEIDRDKSNYLRGMGYKVECKSFEDYIGEDSSKLYDIVVMNPPFSGYRDIKHIAMAFNKLRVGGRVVSLIASNHLKYNEEIVKIFREKLVEYGGKVEELPYGVFNGSGTLVDVSIIVLDKVDSRQRIELDVRRYVKKIS